MRKTKRLLALLLVVAMIGTLLPSTYIAKAADGDVQQNDTKYVYKWNADKLNLTTEDADGNVIPNPEKTLVGNVYTETIKKYDGMQPFEDDDDDVDLRFPYHADSWWDQWEGMDSYDDPNPDFLLDKDELIKQFVGTDNVAATTEDGSTATTEVSDLFKVADLKLQERASEITGDYDLKWYFQKGDEAPVEMSGSGVYSYHLNYDELSDEYKVDSNEYDKVAYILKISMSHSFHPYNILGNKICIDSDSNKKYILEENPARYVDEDGNVYARNESGHFLDSNNQELDVSKVQPIEYTISDLENQDLFQVTYVKQIVYTGPTDKNLKETTEENGSAITYSYGAKKYFSIKDEAEVTKIPAKGLSDSYYTQYDDSTGKYVVDYSLEEKDNSDFLTYTDSSITYDYDVQATLVNNKKIKILEMDDYTGQNWSFPVNAKLDANEGSGVKDMQYVDAYTVNVTIKYGKRELKKLTRVYKVEYKPYVFDAITATSVPARLGGSAEFAVSCDGTDDDVLKDENISLQWYSVDKSGKRTAIKGETLKDLKVRVKDYDTKYVCVLTPVYEDEYKDFTWLPKSDEIIFETVKDSGYRVNEIKPSTGDKNVVNVSAGYEEDTILSVDAQVDPEYSLEYQWYEYTGYSAATTDENGDTIPEKWEERKYTGAGATSNSITIMPMSSKDFDNYGPNGTKYRYRLEVTEKDKSKQEYAKHVYYFRMNSAPTAQYQITANNTEVRVGSVVPVERKIVNFKNEVLVEGDYNDDVELNIDVDAKPVYKSNVTWYEKTDVREEYTDVIYKADADGNDQFESYKYINEAFQEPANSVSVPEYEDVENEDGDVIRHYYRRFYTKMNVSGNVNTLPGKGANGKSIDYTKDSDKYLAIVNVTRGSGENVELDQNTWVFYNIKYDSDLSAYVKNKTVNAIVGDDVILETVAQNENQENYPISYKWQKYDESKANGVYAEKWDDVIGVDGKPIVTSTLNLNQITKAQAGMYRAIVSDFTTPSCITDVITVTVKDKEVEKDNYIAYTPEVSWYKTSIGNTVNLKADFEVSEGVDVFYQWYRADHVFAVGEDTSKKNVQWELLNTDTSGYDVTILKNTDYSSYKCVVSFKGKYGANGEYQRQTHTFLFVIDGYKNNDLQLENLTPRTQYKNIGASAEYAVRPIINDSSIKESDITYQWSINNEKIENATNSKLVLDKIAADQMDDSNIKVTASYTDANDNEIIATMSFSTSRISNVKVENNGETIEAKLGENVTFVPEITNPDNVALTYQWYRDKKIIYGATSERYTVKNIGQNDYGVYSCNIYQDEAKIATYSVGLYELEEESEPETQIIVKTVGENNIEAVLGDKVTMEVTAKSTAKSGDSKLHYQWYTNKYRSEINGHYENIALLGATSPKLEFEKIKDDQYGTYYCVVKDSEGHSATSNPFTVSKSTGLEAINNAENAEDLIGVEVSIGQNNVALNTDVTAADLYKDYIFYDWSFSSMDGKIEDSLDSESGSSLNLGTITQEKLGYYTVSVTTANTDVDEYATKTYVLNFFVYVNTGLKVVTSNPNPVANANGAINMRVHASANANETIKYFWSFKPTYAEYTDEEEEQDIVPVGVDEDVSESSLSETGTLTLPEIKRATYGKYTVTVSTSGEKKTYSFDVKPSVKTEVSRDCAMEGENIDLSVKIINAATDIKYEYEWFYEDPVTNTFMKTNKKGAKCQVLAPKIYSSNSNGASIDIVKQNFKVNVTEEYVTNPKDTRKTVENSYTNACIIIPAVNFKTTAPETTHPFDESYNIQGVEIADATSITMTFDNATDVDAILIDENGKIVGVLGDNIEKKIESNVTYSYDTNLNRTYDIKGKRVIVIAMPNYDDEGNSYGYKLSKFTPNIPAKPSVETNSSDKKADEKKTDGKKADDKKADANKNEVQTGTTIKVGDKVTIGNNIYKVTKISAQSNTVTLLTSKSKKVTKVVIPDTVKINDATYKVTVVAKNAFKNLKKLKTLVVGKNVRNIGAGAFSGDKKLTSITFKGKALKKVGKSAFKSVPKKAKAKVTKKQKKLYKKLLKQGGYKGKVK